MTERARDLSHAQLLDQISLRIGDVQLHIDKRLDAQDARLLGLERKIDDHSGTLTDMAVSIARLEAAQASQPVMQEDKSWAATPRVKRTAVYCAIAAACVAILGGMASAYREGAIIMQALHTALLQH
jgi:hypothetical protein